MNKLDIMNNLSLVIESIACDFTGQAKEGIYQLMEKLGEGHSSVEEYNCLYNDLDAALNMINQLKAKQAARMLSPVIRKMWNENYQN